MPAVILFVVNLENQLVVGVVIGSFVIVGLGGGIYGSKETESEGVA